MHMILTLLLVAAQVPVGTPIAQIGKLRPATYIASRSNLPTIGTLTPAQRKSFTGIVWQDGSLKAPGEFRAGKRLMHPSMGRLAGQSLDAYLKTLDPKKKVRYSTPALTGFQVKLPGDEKKIIKFTGTLHEGQTSIGIDKGKVTSFHISRGMKTKG
jgi:hypothetical protein